jgi:hypothetical protein
MRKRKARGDHHFASLISDAIRWTPEVTNLVPVVSIILYFRSGASYSDSLMVVKDKLEAAGLLTMPREVSEALREVEVDTIHIPTERDDGGSLQDDDSG